MSFERVIQSCLYGSRFSQASKKQNSKHSTQTHTAGNQLIFSTMFGFSCEMMMMKEKKICAVRHMIRTQLIWETSSSVDASFLRKKEMRESSKARPIFLSRIQRDLKEVAHTEDDNEKREPHLHKMCFKINRYLSP